ncbi:MAG: hypothetical protein QNJ62_14645 [Methyloceanibacter sp.]|nr:hypothetical protein [Methyloceanibacter sp.]
MTIAAIKISVIVERFLLPEVERILASEGANRYSTYPGGGKGEHSTHPFDAASVVREFSIVKVEAIVLERATAERIADKIAYECLKDQSGIVWLEGVEVLRRNKF